MRRILAFVLALALSLVVAAPASADLFVDVITDYAEDFKLDACKYSERDLRKLKDVVPVDQNAYTPDFVAALDDAIARRAEGGCNSNRPAPQTTAPVVPGSGAAPPPPPVVINPLVPAPAPTPAPAQAPPTPAVPPTAAPAVAATDAIAVAAQATDPATDAPFPVLVLAILAGLLALGGLLAGLARWRAWEPAWAERMRHATGEAGWRASSTWAEFADFVRFGR